ncbi:MAG: 6-hydroxymethylpterin diphosphokinase MptE-like protein [Spirochaetota bacterium]
MSISLHTATLHSKYDPWKEAEKYLRHSSVSADSSIYLLIEPGRGYLTHLLHELNPKAKIIEVHCSQAVEPLQSLELADTERWNPQCEQNLSAFLAEHIDDLDIGTVSILEWPPAERVFGSLFNEVKTAVRKFLQERRGTIHTTGKFGRLWLRNSLKRAAHMPPLLKNIHVQTPIVIAASGPSLNSTIPLLQQYHRELFILSLPSSISTLRDAGIQPDMIVHSDPGFYAGYHLRCADSAHSIAAAPLFSAGYRHSQLPLALLSTATPIEEFFVRELSLNPIRIESHGTVAGIAFQLALQLGRPKTGDDSLKGPPIIFAGLDFCYDDILAHTRPHSFEKLFYAGHTRFRPIQHIYYARSPRSEAKGKHQTFALERYAGWFQQLGHAYRRKVYRLFPSSVEIPGFTGIGAKEFMQIVGRNRYKAEDGYCSFTGEKYSAEPQHISNSDSRSALVRYSQALQTQFATLTASAASEDSYSGKLLDTLAGLPLLREFIQYTDYSLLFRLRRETAGFEVLRNSFKQNMHAIESLIQAVRYS